MKPTNEVGRIDTGCLLIRLLPVYQEYLYIKVFLAELSFLCLYNSDHYDSQSEWKVGILILIPYLLVCSPYKHKEISGVK